MYRNASSPWHHFGYQFVRYENPGEVKLETEVSCRGPELFGGWLLHCAGTPEPWASSDDAGHDRFPLKGSFLEGKWDPLFQKKLGYGELLDFGEE